MVVVVAAVVAVVVVGGEGNGEVQEMVVGEEEEEEEVVTATAPQPLSSLDTFTYGKKIQNKKKYSTTLSYASITTNYFTPL